MFSAKFINRCLAVGGLLVFVYLLLKASFIDITNDEAYSFYIMKHFWYAEALCTGNTHWLNSLAIKCALLFNCENVLAIRWFSLLSAAVFILTGCLWIRSLNQNHLKLIAFAALFFNPYILDYFALARGYAPGLMFECLAILCICVAELKNNGKLLFLGLLYAGLSALANYSFMYFFVVFCAFYFIRYYLIHGKTALKSLAFYRDVLFALGITLFVLRALVFLRECSNDYIGAGTNNISEFLRIAAGSLIYDKVTLSNTALTFLAITSLLVLLASSAYGLFSFKRRKNFLFYFCSLILFAVLLLTLGSHLFFNTVLPAYRSAIFLFPLAVVCVVYTLDSVLKKEILKTGIVSLLSLLLLVNFAFSANFNWVLDYKFNADTKACMDELNRLKAKRVGMCRELYGDFRNYYQQTENNTYRFYAEKISIDTGIYSDTLCAFDYVVIISPNGLLDYKPSTITFKTEKLFPESGTLILKTACAGRN